jgi:hypothetical protein
MMVTRLVQKSLFGDTLTLEVVGEEVRVHTKSLFNEERLTVLLTVLNPEPAINGARLEFFSRVNGEALISLRPGKPNTKEFNDFVNMLRERARDEYNSFAGLRHRESPAPLPGNVYDDPFELDAAEAAPAAKRDVDPSKVGDAIRLLAAYLDADEIAPLTSALEALKAEPESEDRLGQVVEAFCALGVSQGAALTYAPYLGVLMSDRAVGEM